MKPTLVIFALFASLLWAQPRGGKINGKLTDLSGNPYSNAKGHLAYTDGISIEMNFEVANSGAYSCMGLASGKAKLTFTIEGMEPVAFEFIADQSMQTYDWIIPREGESIADLPPQPKVRGRVFDTSQKPLADVKITLSTPTLKDFKRETVCDENGAFEIESLGGMKIELLAHKEDYRDQILIFTQSKTADHAVKDGDYRMQTLAEAYKELGIEPPPKEQKVTPEELAVDFYNKAVPLYQNKQYEESLEQAMLALEQNPNLKEATKIALYNYRGMENWPKTVEYGEKLLALDPKDENMMNLILDAALKGKIPAKIKQYNDMIQKLKPITPESLYKEALEAINQKNDKLASEKLNAVLKLKPQHANAFLQMGNIFIREGDYEKGLMNLKLFLKYAPENDPQRKEITQLVIDLSE